MKPHLLSTSLLALSTLCSFAIALLLSSSIPAPYLLPRGLRQSRPIPEEEPLLHHEHDPSFSDIFRQNRPPPEKKPRPPSPPPYPEPQLYPGYDKIPPGPSQPHPKTPSSKKQPQRRPSPLQRTRTSHEGTSGQENPYFIQPPIQLPRPSSTHGGPAPRLGPNRHMQGVMTAAMVEKEMPNPTKLPVR